MSFSGVHRIDFSEFLTIRKDDPTHCEDYTTSYFLLDRAGSSEVI